MSSFVEHATIDYLGGEVSVRDYLEAGHDPGPVIHSAMQTDLWGM